MRLMFVEEIIYNNIPKVCNEYEKDCVREYMDLTLMLLDEFHKVEYSEDNMKYVKGNEISWYSIYMNIYNSKMNYVNEYKLPCNNLASILDNTLNQIKEISGKKRNKIAFEYLMGYREDKKISLLRNSEGNDFLKSLIYNYKL